MDRRVTREQLDILGRLPFAWWDDSFIAEDANRTYVLTRSTQVDTIPGLGYGYYVFVIYGKKPYVWSTDRNNFTVTSATFFEDDDRLYCNTTAERAAEAYLNNLRKVSEIKMHAVAE